MRSKATQTQDGTKTPDQPAEAKKQSWRDVLQVHPACEVFPMMSGDELRELSESIKKNGLQQPVILIREAREDGDPPVPRLIDGRNRLDAMELAGIKLIGKSGNLDPAQVTRLVLDDGEIDPYEYVISANIRRRHLTGEQRDAALRALIKANPEKSNRQLAKAVGRSPTHAGKVRNEMEDAGVVSTVDTITDAKGVKQPAKKAKKKNKQATQASDPGQADTTAGDVPPTAPAPPTAPDHQADVDAPTAVAEAATTMPATEPEPTPPTAPQAPKPDEATTSETPSTTVAETDHDVRAPIAALIKASKRYATGGTAFNASANLPALLAIEPKDVARLIDWLTDFVKVLRRIKRNPPPFVTRLLADAAAATPADKVEATTH